MTLNYVMLTSQKLLKLS